jgi:hypothetical protein
MNSLPKQILIAGLALGFVGAAGAWTGNSQTPPAGNTPAPVNVSSVRQSKQGILGVGGLGVFGKAFVSDNTGYSLASRLQFGVNGSVGAAEYCDETGEKCVTIEQILNITNGGIDTDTANQLSCPSTPAYVSGPKATPGFAAVNIPAECASAAGCVIKHSLTKLDKNNAEVVHNTYFTNFRQDTLTDGTPSGWWSSYAQYSAAKNGDKVVANVAYPVIYKKKTYWIAIWDDHSSAKAEQKTSQLTTYDVTGIYGLKLWFCTYSNASVAPANVPEA